MAMVTISEYQKMNEIWSTSINATIQELRL
jgi:hypothetical protein